MLTSNIFWFFVTVISVLVEWIVFISILNRFGKNKVNKVKFWINLLTYMCIIVILTVIGFDQNSKLGIGIILFYLFCIKIYDIDKLNGLFIVLVYLMVLIGFDALSSSILIKLKAISDVNELFGNNSPRLLSTFLSKSMLLLVIPIVKASKINIDIKGKDFLFMLIPTIANIITITILFGFLLKKINIDSIESTGILIISFILLISNLSLVSIVCRIIKDNNLRNDNKIIKEKINMQYKYYTMLQESYSKTKKLYHDMKNHVICLQNIYGTNDIANQYIGELSKELEDSKITFSTNNIILDIILNDKNNICKFEDIELMADINFSKCDFIEMFDICSIFSNMLDNSIEACSKITEKEIKKKIKLKGNIVRDFFVIKCENTKINDIMFDKEVILTDKKDKFSHGIGIESIKTSIQKYNGNIEIKSEKNRFIMTIYIPLVK